MADEKTEEPTERKIEKAHEEGNFPKSQEFSSACTMGVVVLALGTGGSLLFDQLRVLLSIGLDFWTKPLIVEVVLEKTGLIFGTVLWLLAPIALVAGLAGAIGVLAQVGFHISFKPVTPKFENISPAKGIKKIFSIKSVLDLVQMFIRALIVGAISWWLIRAAVALVAGAPYQSLPIIGETAWRLILRLLEFSLLAFVILSGADYALQRWQFMKGQRMSKDEVKREYKESEGDPMIKGARMQLARENAESAPAPALHEANVVLVNPTHYAVAIAYEPGRLDVPVVVARGVDLEAKAIRDQATLLGIPILSNPPLARALYKTEVNARIPREFFGVVAAIFVWLNNIEALNNSVVDNTQAPAGLE